MTGIESSEIAVRARGLVKDYGSVHAVRGIDLEVRRGEVFGFLGPNGAGKSTTIRCLLDLLRPTAGSIEVFGLDPRREGIAVRSRVAYVPGELRLPDGLTGAELVASIGRLRGDFDSALRDALAERLHLDLRRQLRALSSGNRRKVALLLGFLAQADLLILDEPTNGLDPLMQREFLALVREARAAGRTVFLSSHVLSEVQRVADRVVVLGGGRVIAQGSVEELRERLPQRIEVQFSEMPPREKFAHLAGLSEVVIDGHRLSAALTGSIDPFIAFAAGHHIVSISIQEPDLEDAILALYGQPA